MALPAATVQEVRASGNDLNGGGFVPGGSGTDFSQQDSPALSRTDLACADGSTTTVTIGVPLAQTSHTNNLLRISTGTNFVAGVYHIVSRPNTTSYVLDRNPTNGSAASGGTFRIGGSLATVRKAVQGMTVAGMKTWVRQGAYAAYTDTDGWGAITTAANGTAAAAMGLAGYGTVRGDGGLVTVAASGVGNGVLYLEHSFWSLANFAVDGGNSANYGVATDGVLCSFRNVHTRRAGYASLQSGALSVLEGCSAYGGGSLAGIVAGNSSRLIRCGAAMCDGAGIVAGYDAVIEQCLSAKNGAMGISITNARPTISNSILYGNGGSGITLASAALDEIAMLAGNVIGRNGEYGIASVTDYTAAGGRVLSSRNYLWANTSGALSNMPTSLSDEYSADSASAGDPFVDGMNLDFRLTPGTVGQRCRKTVTWFPGETNPLTFGYDIGAIPRPLPAARLINGGLLRGVA